MKKNIDDIVQELITIDPSFATHGEEMRNLITELIAKKPDTHLDEQFVARLRAQLQGKPTLSPFTQYFSYMPYAFAVLVALIAVPIGYQYISSGQTSGSAVFAMNQEIQALQRDAYGTLQSQEGGRGGGTMTMSAADVVSAESAPTPAPTVAQAVAHVGADTPKMASGMGGGTSDSRMMVPQGPITVHSYVYKGDALELSGTEGAVYRRVPGKNSSGQIASQLRKFNFGLINLGAYSDARVRSFELAEDKPFGYSISVNFDEGTIGINANYTQWPSLSGKEAQPQQLPASAMPKEGEVIAIATKFLNDHDISLVNYGEPVAQEYSNIAASEMQFAPEQVTVTYPLKISGTPVYEDGAYPYGLQVGVSVRDKKVMSVYGLTSQTYTSSSYKLETNSEKILSVLGKGGPHAWLPQESDGVQIKKVEIEVGAPEKVLMHTYNYKDGESQELFVPALSFPVIKAPAGEEYYPKNILVPLIPELLNSESGPVMYNMKR